MFTRNRRRSVVRKASRIHPQCHRSIEIDARHLTFAAYPCPRPLWTLILKTFYDLTGSSGRAGLAAVVLQHWSQVISLESSSGGNFVSQNKLNTSYTLRSVWLKYCKEVTRVQGSRLPRSHSSSRHQKHLLVFTYRTVTYTIGGNTNQHRFLWSHRAANPLNRIPPSGPDVFCAAFAHRWH